MFKGTSLRDLHISRQFIVEALLTTSIDRECSKLKHVVIMSFESFLDDSLKYLFLGVLLLEPQCIFLRIWAHFDFTGLNNLSKKFTFKKIQPLLFYTHIYFDCFKIPFVSIFHIFLWYFLCIIVFVQVVLAFHGKVIIGAIKK